MKNKLQLIISLICALSINTAMTANKTVDESKTIFQVAPLSALVKSVYDGTYTYGELIFSSRQLLNNH